MAGEAAASGLRFFLDRGLGSHYVPDALRNAGWQLETMDERLGVVLSQKAQDQHWIEEAALRGEVVLCKDLAIAKSPVESQVVYMSSARLFGLSSARLTGDEMIKRFLDAEARIISAALRAQGPYVMSVGEGGTLQRKRLKYP